jgi:hypothetical protein
VRTEPDAWDRYDPLGGAYAFSNDIDLLEWRVTHEVPFNALSFWLTDAYDMGPEPGRGPGLPESWFRLTAAGAEWSIPQRDPTGTAYLVNIMLHEWVSELVVTFHTRVGDGFGVSSPHVNPIPLPASALLLLGGLAILGWRARR